MGRKIRVTIYVLILMVCTIWTLTGLPGRQYYAQNETTLPQPVVTGQSVETCLNSRESTRKLTGTASMQQIGNVLWAAGKAPQIGSNRTISVATQDGTYQYHPDNNSLTQVSKEPTSQGAFKIIWESDLVFDAGLIYMPALLAAVSMWGTDEPHLACSPKDLFIYYGIDDSLQLKTEVAAHSSIPEGQPGWLPDPSTTGNNKFEEILSNLQYTDSFSQTDFTIQQISQLLWAGYGCTPHKQPSGLTVPSALAQYYLTGKIYLINENGVSRYHNRQPNDVNFNTSDHRLEQLNPTDIRTNLRSSISGLPQAPCYIVLCLDDTELKTIADKYDLEFSLASEFANLETGFVAFNYLLQASAMGAGCSFKTQLTSSEQKDIQTLANIPLAQTPMVIVNLGMIQPTLTPSNASNKDSKSPGGNNTPQNSDVYSANIAPSTTVIANSITTEPLNKSKSSIPIILGVTGLLILLGVLGIIVWLRKPRNF